MNVQIQNFLELISCSHSLFYWCYDAKQNLINSTCNYETILNNLFIKTGGLEFSFNEKIMEPAIFNGMLDLLWISVREFEKGQLFAVHVIGPFFFSEVDAETPNKIAKKAFGEESNQLQSAANEALLSLPTISISLYTQYAIMFQFVITGERIPVSSIQYQTDDKVIPKDFSNLKVQTAPKDRTSIYRAERALLNVVREGNLNGASIMMNASNIAKIRQYTDNNLQNAQIACTTFVTLCTRAAIEGGVPITLCYSLGDAYIKSIFLAKNLSEVSGIKNQMYSDFTSRVRDCRTNPKYSKMVQSSCDFIELHLAETLNIDTLAYRLGYSKYYLSTCFKKETSYSINDYIKFARVERAKILLSTTDNSIDDIAEQTGFVSRSFFSNTFKRCVGKTPAMFRKEELKF